MLKNKCQNKTRPNTAVEYARRINKALEFIVAHLDENLQLEDVASASHFSPFHFHRIFHALVGETVNEYVTRKRMEKAVTRLISKPAMSITDIAVVGGYSSSANFSKAFKLYFGLSPSELRIRQVQDSANNKNSKKGKLYSKYGKAFNPQDLYSQFVTQSEVFNFGKLEDILMKVKVKNIQEKQVVYLTSDDGYKIDSIYGTWDKLLHWVELKGLDVKINERLGICHDNPSITPEEKCRYDAAIVVSSDVDVSPPYQQTVIPMGKYAVANYKDDADKISNFMTELCSHWFPTSGYEPDDYPPVFNYLNDSREDGFVEMDVYIKVKELAVS